MDQKWGDFRHEKGGQERERKVGGVYWATDKWHMQFQLCSHILLFEPCHQPMEWALWQLPLFKGWGDWGAEGFGDFLATQLENGRTKIHTQSPRFHVWRSLCVLWVPGESPACARSWGCTDVLDPAPGLQQLGLGWALMTNGVHVPWLLVQGGPILAFGLLEYCTPIKRIIKEIRSPFGHSKKKKR